MLHSIYLLAWILQASPSSSYVVSDLPKLSHPPSLLNHSLIWCSLTISLSSRIAQRRFAARRPSVRPVYDDWASLQQCICSVVPHSSHDSRRGPASSHSISPHSFPSLPHATSSHLALPVLLPSSPARSPRAAGTVLADLQTCSIHTGAQRNSCCPSCLLL